MSLSRHQGREWQDWPGLALWPLSFLTVFWTGFHSLIDSDIWFHLRAGSEIARGHIPRVDTFSYPSAGRPYVDLHWLFQLVAWLVHRAAGERGLVWFACLCVTAAFFALYRLARREAPAPLAAALTALGAIVASERFSPRPELFSFLLLALFQLGLRRHREGARRAWIYLPAIVLVWANCEGLFVLAYVLLLAALLDQPKDRRLWQALGLSLLCSLANPYFVTGALHPLLLFTRVNQSLPIYSATIGEFLRPSLNPFSDEALYPALTVFPFYLGLIVLGLLLRGRWPRRSEVFLLAAFTYLACNARRNVALLPLVATPVLAAWIARGLKRPAIAGRWLGLTSNWKKTLGAGAAAAAILVLAGYDLGLITNRLYTRAETNREFGTGPAAAGYPRGAAEFLKTAHVQGPLFTTFAAGSYLTWAYPAEPVFIDGRLEVHRDSHYARYLRVLQGGPFWAEAETEYKFKGAVIQYMDAMSLTLDRLRDPGWSLVYLDDNAMVMLKRDGQNQQIIEDHAFTGASLRAAYPAWSADRVDSSLVIPPLPLRSMRRWFQRESFPWSRMQLGQFFYAVSRWDLALAQFLEAARAAPGEAGPRLMAAAALNQLSRPQLAWEMLQTAEALGGNHGIRRRALAQRGDLLLALNKPSEAEAAYAEYLRDSPPPRQRPLVLANRGLARLRGGNLRGAYEDVMESLRLQPEVAQTYWYLGLVDEALGNPAEAKRAYETFRTMGGRSSEVDAALKRLGAS